MSPVAHVFVWPFGHVMTNSAPSARTIGTRAEFCSSGMSCSMHVSCKISMASSLPLNAGAGVTGLVQVCDDLMLSTDDSLTHTRILSRG